MLEITSEMTGLIDNVLVKEGDEVTEGFEIYVIESMKTLMQIKSTVQGRIIEIKVEPGDFVEEGEVIMVVEN